MISSSGLAVSCVPMTDGAVLQHLLEFNERPDLSHEDREMLIEDLVYFTEFNIFLPFNTPFSLSVLKSF